MSDRILGAACVLTSAAMAWAVKDYGAAISYEPVGPRAFPLLLAGLMGLAGIWLVLRPTLQSGSFHGVPIKHTLVCLGAIVVYSLLFETLGFALATALMAVPIGLAFGGTWKQSLVAGLGLGVALFFIFDKVLDVVLPTGVLSWLLGGR
ncbi:tripartite tricarboxylate transporter TctB family protein [Piscinibacter sp. HJYY11]|uniref:tripartite tricarboxylate transporter TctB family protein n=1 Tax=Piscinibacter sp. HJYY11 TaxID=2801333 RepID=UPI00191F6893|nr:tripartite tricarboxylate transporter TctB family protein [Piscinibacter sp. HJYY11]MBL0729431.1 tripartite tricarboxylate transporter TctB family protein [Piscinibacter sp. HJYY11]